MFFSDHILCFLLAVLLHLLGLLLISNRLTLRDPTDALTPELDVSSVELTLTGAETATPAVSAAERAAAASTRQPEPPPPLELPKPVEPVPLPTLPEKPSFTDTLTPPPEPTPEPAPEPEQKPPPPPAPQPVTSEKPSEQAAAPSPDAAAQQTTIQPSSGGAYGRVDAHPSLERAIRPNYPIGARRRGEEGTVILDVSVTAGGRASAVSLVTSSGFPELDRAAVKAVAQARFKPGTRNGESVDSAARLTIIFRLRDQ